MRPECTKDSCDTCPLKEVCVERRKPKRTTFLARRTPVGLPTRKVTPPPSWTAFRLAADR